MGIDYIFRDFLDLFITKMNAIMNSPVINVNPGDAPGDVAVVVLDVVVLLSSSGIVVVVSSVVVVIVNQTVVLPTKPAASIA